jgi:hypothetical protein
MKTTPSPWITISIFLLISCQLAFSQLQVTSPNGGEKWQSGSTHNITWTSTGTSGNVHIEYSTDNGTSWNDVIATTADTGSYPWIVPDELSANCLVSITDTDGDPSDTSDALFTISPVTYSLSIMNNGEGSVTLNPAGGIYIPGTTVAMTPEPGTGYLFNTWTGDNYSDILDIGGGSYTILIDSNKSIVANFRYVVDSLALVALYDSTDGDNWTNHNNWLTGPLNTWYGVTIASGRVTQLFLRENNLTGHIPPEIGNLSGLQNLYLLRNHLTGSIPPEFGKLSSLQQIYSGHNQLSGNIPPEIGDLSNLIILFFGDNRLTGSIPPEIGNLSNLREVAFYGNQLTGDVPDDIQSLVKLTNILIYDNRLENLPDLSALPALNTLLIASNKFTFEDIEPNIAIADSFTYSPQDSVGEARLITINEGDDDTLSVSVGGEHNVYQWFKDGAALSGEQNDTLKIIDALPEDTGVYICQITNAVVTGLTLYSRPITITITTASIIPVITDYIIVNGTDLQFTFEAISETASMNAYRDTIAAFTPDRIGGSNRVATQFTDEDPVAAGVQWTDEDVTGDASGNYFYIFTTVNGAESENSTTIGAFNFELVTTPTTDFNEIALPLAIRGVTSAAELMTAIPGCNSVARWVAGMQGYEMYIEILPATNFAVTAGYPYYVNVAGDVVFTLVGELVSPVFNLITTATTDFNEVMLPLDKTNITSASALMADIPSCNSVAKWNAGIQGYDQYISVLPATNFVVRTGYPYYVNILSDCTWPSGGGGPLKSTSYESAVMIERSSAPHLVYGTIRFSNAELMPDDLDFSAWFPSSPEDKLTRNSAGCMLKDGVYVIQCNTFSTGWVIEETLKIDFRDRNGRLLNSTEVQLSYNPADKAMDITLGDEKSYLLSQNVPNPFTEETVIEYQIEDDGTVLLEVYSINGQKIKSLVNENKKAGIYKVYWNRYDSNNRRVPDGLYIYLLKSKDYVVYKKAIVMQ